MEISMFLLGDINPYLLTRKIFSKFIKHCKACLYFAEISTMYSDLSKKGTIGSSRNHGAFVKIEDFKMLKFRRIV